MMEVSIHEYEVSMSAEQFPAEPVQKRSIEKKNRIIQAGFELFCTKGFNRTNTAEIAKHASVSTGIVYRYFKDKREIFIASLPLYFDRVNSMLFAYISTITPPVDFPVVLDLVLDIVVESHTGSAFAFSEMMALSYADPQIMEFLDRSYEEMNHTLGELFLQFGIAPDHMYERVHLIMDIIENYAHEVAFKKVERLDYPALKKIIIQMIISLITADDV
jgi:AcrR family transcriptional regulator